MKRDGRIWRRVGNCNKQACVELSKLPDGRLLLRGSERPLDTVVLARDELSQFVQAAKDGELDSYL